MAPTLYGGGPYKCMTSPDYLIRDHPHIDKVYLVTPTIRKLVCKASASIMLCPLSTHTFRKPSKICLRWHGAMGTDCSCAICPPYFLLISASYTTDKAFSLVWTMICTKYKSRALARTSLGLVYLQY